MSPSPSPPLSGGRGFYKEGEGNRRKRSREGVEKSSTCRPAQSIPIRPNVGHPALSSWLHVTLAPWLKVSKSPGPEMLEDWSLFPLKLVPRILTQTCCSSTRYILGRVSTYRNNVKRIMGEVTISHC